MDVFHFTSPLRIVVSAVQWLIGQFDSDVRLVRRFVRVCKAHGIEPTQIYRAFPENELLPSDFSRLSGSAEKITPRLVEEFCRLFDIERDWLETGMGDCQNKGHTYK